MLEKKEEIKRNLRSGFSETTVSGSEIDTVF